MAFKIKRKKEKLNKNTNYEIPYHNKVKFFANKNTKRITNVEQKFIGKGWYEIRVGDQRLKTRDPHGEVDRLLREKYPNYKPLSLFSELSYHSGLTRKGKIAKYGTNDYNLQYSDYKPLETYALEQPVKSTRKDEFGKIRKQVKLLEWEYIVLDWIPDKKIRFQIKHQIFYPFDEEKTIFRSKKYNSEEKDQAIKDFKNYVKKQRRK